MRLLRNISLQRKQTLIILMTSGAALLLACLLFIGYDVLTFRRAMVQTLTSLADVVGNNAIASLEFDDPQSAAEILSALKGETHIEGACIYRTDGSIFAVYDRSDADEQRFPQMLPQDGSYFSQGTLHVFRLIKEDGQVVGTVYLESDLEVLLARLQRYLLIVALVFVLASLVAFFLSRRLQQVVSKPILQLVETAQAVAAEKNFSLRAVKPGNDELGMLVDSFNSMLSEIQHRDGELQKARDVLEQRVEERTRDLRVSEQRFASAFEEAPIGMALVSTEGRWLKTNRLLCRFLGYTQSDLLKKTFQEITHPLDLGRDVAELKRLLAGEISSYHIEKRYFHKLGHTVWALLGVSLVRDEQGQPVHFISQLQDITDRKQVEAALRESEEESRTLTEALPQLVWIARADGSNIHFNKKWFEFTGLNWEESVGQGWNRVTHPDDQKHVQAKWEQAIKTGQTYEVEYRLRRYDGVYRWVLVRALPLRNTDGQIVKWFGTSTDIDDQKRAEEAARNTEELYRRAIAGAGAVPYFYDYKTRSYQFIGEGIEKLIGYSPQEMGPKLWVRIIQESVMAGDSAGMEKAEASRRVLDGELNQWRCDMRVITKDGKTRWIADAAVQNRDENGAATGSMGILQDITERKESEQALRQRDDKFNQLANNITDVFWIRSPDMKKVLYVSPAFERIWGRSTGTHYSNPEKWIEAIYPEDREFVVAEFEKLTRDSPEIDVEYRIIRTDGELRWIQSRGFQVRDADGKIVSLTGIVTDITARKKAEISAEAFSTLGRSLSSVASPSQAAEIISQISSQLIGWDAFSIQLCSEDGNSIASIYEADTVEGKRVTTTETEPRKPTELHQRIFLKGAEIILRETPDAPVPGAISFGNKSQPSASMMYAPIRSRSRPIGILSVHSYTPKAYHERDLNTLQTLADQCGGALERIRADEALRKSESQFRLVWNNSADGMRLTNGEGRVLLVNDAYCKMVGKTRQELEANFFTVIHRPENVEHVLQRHREQIVTGKAISHLETEVTLWDGKEIWMELSNSILRLPNQPVLLLSMFRDITERKSAEAELAGMHAQLLETSRRAGMAEVATSVLHNVGNVLNSVNVSSSIIREKIERSKVTNLGKVVKILEEHAENLPEFFSSDPRSRQLPQYLSQLATHLVGEQENVMKEIGSLVTNVQHIKEIVTMQQNYAKVSGITELLELSELVEDALRLNAAGIEQLRVKVVREFSEIPAFMIEKHKVLQILVNLIRNAKHAMEANTGTRELRLRIYRDEEGQFACVSVEDNGIGITPENLTRIFSHGFTTRKEGHGFGLHSGALAAKELGGSLSVRSEGEGRGATFTLSLPLSANAEEDATA